MDADLQRRLRRAVWAERPLTLRRVPDRLGLAAMVNVPWEARRAVFLLSGKCGNSSVQTAVLEAQGITGPGMRRALPRWTLRRIAASDFAKVAMVRNPYARAASLWHGKVLRRKDTNLHRRGGFTGAESFVEFLRKVERMDDWADLHVRAQWKGMVWRGRLLAERVLRLEEPEGWEALREDLPELGPLPKKNASGSPDWRALCEGEAGEIVRRRWAPDSELFGYPTQPLPSGAPGAAPRGALQSARLSLDPDPRP